ncbi:endonuclease/exonuclease/phosphatase family protein [Vibrio scophthalmi]|uniref:Endonuclease/exonuclease/phosphatase domain-containing protein n=1 Tax=Vibrio scophthalmi LMG 19158 TaxID=870967 RepID=F9RSN0_9VIBR|nr:endonuclease/exonuclease/phosphatase family protein [Vibrio scophthalmi]EGU32038.1 hypothetical protein VIS19158_03132 [Vibrio scophthalmi LMG 19158]
MGLLKKIVLWFGIVLPAGLWLALFLNDDIWWLENVTGYPALFFGLYASLCALFLISKHWSKAIICALLSLAFFMLTPVNERSIMVKCENSVSIIQYNIYYENPDTNQLINYLINHPADLVVLQEVSPKVGVVLQTLSDVYPYVYGGQEGVGYPSGQMILSRYPLVDSSVFMTPDQQHIIRTTWQAGQQQAITVFTAHPPSPRTEALWYRRNALMKTIESLNHLYPSDEVLVIGDFNLSSRSMRFTKLFLGFQTAPVASWPNWLQISSTPAASMIGIDHLWLKSASGLRRICQRESLSSPHGSDHKMIRTMIGY